MISDIKVRVNDSDIIFFAWQWNGSDFPPEGWDKFGFMEADNGPNLESCSHDFITDPTVKQGLMRGGFWAIMADSRDASSICSPQWFQEHCTLPDGTPIGTKEKKHTKEELLEHFRAEVNTNMSKTRMIKFPEWMKDPMERRMYFSNESYKKATEEAFLTIMEKLKIQ